MISVRKREGVSKKFLYYVLPLIIILHCLINFPLTCYREIGIFYRLLVLKDILNSAG